jgi:hypothetical protein
MDLVKLESFSDNTLNLINDINSNIELLDIMQSNLFIAENGNIGIGTTNPSDKLTIYNGKIKIHDNTSLDNAVINLLSDTYNTYLFTDRTNGTFYIRSYLDNDVVINSNGNVGIGTTNPQARLHLAGTGDVVLRIQADTNDSGEGDNPMIEFRQDGNLLTGLIGTGNIPTGGGTNDNALYLQHCGGEGIIFLSGSSQDNQTTSTERMRITNTGNVGIGITNPQTKLHIANLTLINSQQDLLIIESHTALTGGGNSILFRNRWNNGSYWNMARITAVEQSGYGGQLIFQTNNGSGSADDTTIEAMRINESGYVGIGTTNPGYKLDVNGSFRSTSFRCNNTNVSETTFSRINSLFDRYHYRYYNQSFNSISYDSSESTNRGTINYSPIWRGNTTMYAVIDLILQTKGYWGSLWHHSSWTGRYVRARLRATYNTYANPHRWEYYVESQFDLTGRGTTWKAANLRIDFLAGNSLTINVHDDGGLAGYIGWSLIELKT